MLLSDPVYVMMYRRVQKTNWVSECHVFRCFVPKETPEADDFAFRSLFHAAAAAHHGAVPAGRPVLGRVPSLPRLLLRWLHRRRPAIRVVVVVVPRCVGVLHVKRARQGLLLGQDGRHVAAAVALADADKACLRTAALALGKRVQVRLLGRPSMADVAGRHDVLGGPMLRRGECGLMYLLFL